MYLDLRIPSYIWCNQYMFSGNRDTLYSDPIKKYAEESNIKIRPRNFSKLFKTVILPKLLKFHSAWYSSNIMCLAVFGKGNNYRLNDVMSCQILNKMNTCTFPDSLDMLEKMVVPLFVKIENKNAKKLVIPFTLHPLGPEQLKRAMHIVPLSSEVQVLRVIFPTPNVVDQYKSAVSLMSIFYCWLLFILIP